MTEEFTQRSNVSSNRLAGAKPAPGSERNRSLIERMTSPDGEVLLPPHDGRFSPLDVEGSRGVPVFQYLISDRYLLADGSAFCVDATGHASDRTAFTVPVGPDVTVDGSTEPLGAIPAFDAWQAAGAGGR
ncbi:MAG: hypothetical protein ACOCQ3_04270 [Natronomonas sp.]